VPLPAPLRSGIRREGQARRVPALPRGQVPVPLPGKERQQERPRLRGRALEREPERPEFGWVRRCRHPLHLPPAPHPRFRHRGSGPGPGNLGRGVLRQDRRQEASDGAPGLEHRTGRRGMSRQDLSHFDNGALGWRCLCGVRAWKSYLSSPAELAVGFG
jgi:hypothetical protein